MNLFDYIKLQATDISDFDELSSLPRPLIKLYWTKTEESVNPLRTRTRGYDLRCMILSLHHSDSRTVFLESLKEYYKANQDESI